MGTTDVATGMATGEIWFKVPAAIQFVLTGKPGKYVSGKDIIILIIGKIGVDGALYKSMEFTGDGIAHLSMDDRFTMANMAIEAGAKNGIFPVDEQTKAYLEEHSKKEYQIFEADEDAARYVAKAADGAMRDALSLLEQCISFYYGQRLTYEKVLDVLGAVDTQVFSKLLRLIIRCDVPGCVQLMDEISSQGRDLSQFVTDFIWYLRNLMLVQTADQSAQALEMTKENYEALREESKMVALSVLMRNIRICSELSNQLKFAVSKRVLIEMAIIKMMQPQMEDDIESLRVRLDQIEEKIASGSFVNNTEPQQSGSIFDSYFEGDAKQPVMQKAAQTVELSEAEYEDYQKISSEWKKLSHMQSGFMNSILMGTNISYDKAKGLCIVFTNKFNYELMLRQERMEELRQMLNKQYQKEFSITAKLLEAGEAMPRITRGSHIEGINMEIGVEDE